MSVEIKNNKPFYKKWWVIAIGVLLVASTVNVIVNPQKNLSMTHEGESIKKTDAIKSNEMVEDEKLKMKRLFVKLLNERLEQSDNIIIRDIRCRMSGGQKNDELRFWNTGQSFDNFSNIQITNYWKSCYKSFNDQRIYELKSLGFNKIVFSNPKDHNLEYTL